MSAVVDTPSERETRLGRGRGRVFSPGAFVELEIALPDWARPALRKTDLDVILMIDAPGADCGLEPVIALDFGTPGSAPLLRWQIDGVAAARGGVRLRLPRGLRKLWLRPHNGPFVARDFACRLMPASVARPRGERLLFEVRAGDEAGIGSLKTRPSLLDATARASHYMELDTLTGRFRTLTADPHIEFDLKIPLGKGWWRIDADMAAPDAARPRIYFADDQKYFEHHSAELTLRRSGRFTGYICLSGSTARVRFDPSCRLGDSGNLQRLSLHPVSPAAVAREAVRPSIWSATRSARASRALLRRLFDPAADTGHWPLPLRMPDEEAGKAGDAEAYASWIARHDYHPARDDPHYMSALRQLDEAPLVSVIMPVYKTPVELLDAAIKSVRAQLYSNWELCIADDASGSPELDTRLRYWMKTDRRIKVAFRETNGNISAATNSAFAMAQGEWVALLDHDDVLRPHALAELVLTAARKPDAQIIYSDEDKLDEDGQRYGPYFKPDFSPCLFYGQNYLNHLTAHRAANIRAVGGWREGFEGSQDYDLNLRILERVGADAVVHIPKVLYHWRAVAGSTAVAVSEKSYAWEAGKRALEEHFARLKLPATVGQVEELPYYRIDWPAPSPEPLVSLIIPTRDRGELVEMCVESILGLSTYQNYEILIVDNQSTMPETFALFDRLQEKDSRVRVLTYNKPFNFSAINNFAARQARGYIIGLVNNDIEVITPDWLEQMVSLAIRDEIGCVGAMLYYPDDRIQHAGVVIGIGGVAGHSHKYLERGTQGYFARLKLVHDVSAVTGACLLVRRAVYEAVGGLNEEHLTIAFNDIDFCLKVRAAGYRNVFTPRAELYHHESVSRGHEDTNDKRKRFQREAEYMIKNWATHTAVDPFYSPHLSRDYEDFRISDN
ncbi:glycosyltransferase family 2 protein [Hyphomonadaceae bacterium BL14]|nr:glycosyltransferase family 2 protein [Hyphomonadaceae bacterium BL14]